MPSPLVEKIISWYGTHARRLPWRDNPDPYAVWVSEVMLQQTRVETVIPYYQRWMKRFPDIPSLAAASQQDALAVWEGLGYYGRARNLHRAAGIVLAEFGGVLPKNVGKLRKLPGIGRYTAGAIASLAFNLNEPVLDGNIRRVLARVFDIHELIRSHAIEKRLWQLAKSHLPERKAGIYNQALMDLGAIVCTPRKPACELCPLDELCQALKLGVQEQRPVIEARPKIPHYTVTAAVIQKHDQVLITRRPEQGLLGGMWEFPGGKLQPGETLDTCLIREIQEELGVVVEVGDLLGIYHHSYTHYKVTLHAFCCEILNSDQPRPIQVQDLRWVTVPEINDFPMGKIDRSIAQKLREGIIW